MIRLGQSRIRLYPGAVDALVNDPDGPVIRDLDRRMTRAQLSAKRRVRVRTGRLMSSIRKNRGFGPRGPYVDVVAGHRSMTPYLGYEHFGTVPHIIQPRFKKALRFSSGGRTVFATRVQHPGTRGSYFLTRALPAAGG